MEIFSCLVEVIEVIHSFGYEYC